MSDDAQAEPENPIVEVWNGERKVSVYKDEVLRIEGWENAAITEHPRNMDEVQEAFDWLYAAQPPAAPVETDATVTKCPHCDGWGYAPPVKTHNCPCGVGEEPCPGADGKPACALSRSSAETEELEIPPRGGMTFDWQEQSLIYQRRLRALMKLVAKEGYAVSSDGRTGMPMALSRFRDEPQAARVPAGTGEQDDAAKRARIAYEAFRGGLLPFDCDVPRWEDAPTWIRDVAIVAYLQGKLDAPAHSQQGAGK